jgi:hypothetical protein
VERAEQFVVEHSRVLAVEEHAELHQVFEQFALAACVEVVLGKGTQQFLSNENKNVSLMVRVLLDEQRQDLAVVSRLLWGVRGAQLRVLLLVREIKQESENGSQQQIQDSLVQPRLWLGLDFLALLQLSAQVNVLDDINSFSRVLLEGEEQVAEVQQRPRVLEVSHRSPKGLVQNKRQVALGRKSLVNLVFEADRGVANRLHLHKRQLADRRFG